VSKTVHEQLSEIKCPSEFEPLKDRLEELVDSVATPEAPIPEIRSYGTKIGWYFSALWDYDYWGGYCGCSGSRYPRSVSITVYPHKSMTSITGPGEFNHFNVTDEALNDVKSWLLKMYTTEERIPYPE
jgi:hypothetical protein